MKGKTIALLGMAFKPGVDDLRESPAVDIAKRLLAAGAKLQVQRPHGTGKGVKRGLRGQDKLLPGPVRSVTGAGVLVIATRLAGIPELDLATVKKLMNTGIPRSCSTCAISLPRKRCAVTASVTRAWGEVGKVIRKNDLAR